MYGCFAKDAYVKRYYQTARRPSSFASTVFIFEERFESPKIQTIVIYLCSSMVKLFVKDVKNLTFKIKGF